jgi:hypothetical protein
MGSAATITKKPVIVAGGRKGVSDGRKLFSRKLQARKPLPNFWPGNFGDDAEVLLTKD